MKNQEIKVKGKNFNYSILMNALEKILPKIKFPKIY